MPTDAEVTAIGVVPLDGMGVLNQLTGIVYIRAGGKWIGTGLPSSTTVIGTVADLRAALDVSNVTTPVGDFVLLPGKYNLGTTGLTIGSGTNNAGTSTEISIQMRGLIPLSQYLTGPAVEIDYAGTGSAISVNSDVDSGFNFMKDIAINLGSGVGAIALNMPGSFQQGTVENVGLFGTATKSQICLQLGTGGAGTGFMGGSQHFVWKNLKCQGGMIGVLLKGGAALNRNVFYNPDFQNPDVTSFKTETNPGGGAGSQGAVFGLKFVGGIMGVSTMTGPVLDLNSVSTGGNLLGDCACIGTEFFNGNTSIVQCSPVGNYCRLIGCGYKATSGLSGGINIATGTGQVHVIGLWESNSGQMSYGGLATPTTLTVGASPWTYQNLVAPVIVKTIIAPQYIQGTGGTVSSVTKNGVTVATSSPFQLLLLPGDNMIVTYTVAPTITSSLLLGL